MKLRAYHIAWAICLLVACSLLLWGTPPEQRTTSSTPPPAPIAGAENFGGEFTLLDHHDHIVTNQSWPGKYRLVYFGFTFCPDVCPMGMSVIAGALEQLPNEIEAKIQPILITVDPERDTVETLKQYVTLFHPDFIGLTGTPEQIEHIKKLYKVYAQKDGTGDDYLINHSAFTYLISPDEKLVGLYAHDTTAKAMAAKITEEIRKITR